MVAAEMAIVGRGRLREDEMEDESRDEELVCPEEDMLELSSGVQQVKQEGTRKHLPKSAEKRQ